MTKAAWLSGNHAALIEGSNPGKVAFRRVLVGITNLGRVPHCSAFGVRFKSAWPSCVFVRSAGPHQPLEPGRRDVGGEGGRRMLDMKGVRDADVGCGGGSRVQGKRGCAGTDFGKRKKRARYHARTTLRVQHEDEMGMENADKDTVWRAWRSLRDSR
ncbi:hypothetical protein B0H11DRAFT_1935107 [Mycena galericulata]|nr:hypothetical protein B0H11DRAFT_1935107 [Mycena galericulata]